MHCQKCKTTENLRVNSKRLNKQGEIRYSYLCKPCDALRHRSYYRAGNQRKYLEANRRYLAKKKVIA